MSNIENSPTPQTIREAAYQALGSLKALGAQDGYAAKALVAALEGHPSPCTSPEPYAACTIDHTGCDHMSRDIELIKRIAAAGSKGPTEVYYLYAGAAPTPSSSSGWHSHDGMLDPDIPGDTLVQVCFRDGDIAFGVVHDWDQNWHWADSEEGVKAPGAIVAWRPHPAPDSSSGGKLSLYSGRTNDPVPEGWGLNTTYLSITYRQGDTTSALGFEAGLEEYVQARIWKDSPVSSLSGEPDYCYDPSEWEFTCNWDDRDQVHGWGDALETGKPMRVATLFAGPDKWVADVPITWDTDGNPDDRETKWFDTEAEAVSALFATAEGSADV
jgi:hypothetical protein